MSKICDYTDYSTFDASEAKKEIAKLTDMLKRICSNENYRVIEMRLPDDIQEWWIKQKESK